MLLQFLCFAGASIDGVSLSSGAAFSVFPNGSGFRLAPRSPDLLPTAFDSNEAAWGRFNDTILETGWSLLEIHTNPSKADEEAATAAGYFEGRATAVRIEQHAVNSGVPDYKMKKEIALFLKQNQQWQAAMMQIGGQTPNGSADKIYWHQVGLVNKQLGGLYQGYTEARKDMKAITKDPLTEQDMLLLNLGGDLEDLEGLDGNCSSISATNEPLSSPVYDKGRCSALLRLTKDNADVMIAQNTWTSLNSMLRIYKMYDFPYTVDGSSPINGKPVARVASTKVSFSSYPGSLYSGDDFYVLSSGIVVQETTIGNSDASLNTKFLSPLTLLEWQRNMVANRLVASGKEWCGIFQKYNSGTYNNQNMILDYNLFTPGEPLQVPHSCTPHSCTPHSCALHSCSHHSPVALTPLPCCSHTIPLLLSLWNRQNDTFWLCEQIPGYVYGNDLSAKLQRDR
jgi:hypothetical protein